MGWRNVMAAMALYEHLDDAPYRLLLGMAKIALDPGKGDDDRAPMRFFGGERVLIQLAGGSKSKAYRAREALVAAGAMSVVQQGTRGKRAEYELHLTVRVKGPADGT